MHIYQTMDHLKLKLEIYEKSLQLIEGRLHTIKENIKELIVSKNSETKSSAGDKYETGRAMMQNEEDLYKRQLADTQQVYKSFISIPKSEICDVVKPGALIKLPAGWFYLGAAIGKIRVQNIDVYCISLQSPIGKALKGLQANEKVHFNEQIFTIQELY